MFVKALWPDYPGLEFEGVIECENKLCFSLKSTVRFSLCPKCSQPSQQVHSKYRRHLTDLPMANLEVTLHLQVRKFFCITQTCPQKIFSERLEPVATAYARRTTRLLEVLTKLGLQLGGEAAARAARTLAISTGADTVLRLVASQVIESAKAKIIGVDDFAFRRGQRYGTLIVDLERHKAIDLLPDRTSQSLSQWLSRHPEVEIISRDRAGAYARAANEAAPQARQVADRWHLAHNLADKLKNFLERRQIYKKVAIFEQTEETKKATGVLKPVAIDPGCSTSLAVLHHKQEEADQSTVVDIAPVRHSQTNRTPKYHLRHKLEEERTQRRQGRLARYSLVQQLHQQGLSERLIAQRLNMGRNTVSRYLKAEDFPEIGGGVRRTSKLSPYQPYILERWKSGVITAQQLWEEIEAQGYQGSVDGVRRYLAWLRAAPPQNLVLEKQRAKLGREFSARNLTRLFLQVPEKLTPEETACLRQLWEWDCQSQLAYDLVQQFMSMLRKKQGELVEEWLSRVSSSKISELESFARGLKADKEAVVAGLTLSYSNAQLEGQVNRLKLIKRSMYNRANFSLLRTRVLAGAA